MKPIHKIKIKIQLLDEEDERIRQSGIAAKFEGEEAGPSPVVVAVKISEMFHALMRHEIIRLTEFALHAPELFKNAYANEQTELGRPQHALSASDVPEES